MNVLGDIAYTSMILFLITPKESKRKRKHTKTKVVRITLIQSKTN